MFGRPHCILLFINKYLGTALQRSESIESTMSEKEFSKKYQQITHRYFK